MEINLIQNPGFELGGTPPTGWEFNTFNGITPTMDMTSPHSGTRCLKFDVPGNTPIISGSAYQLPMVTVKPLTKYTLSGWGKQSSTSSWNAGGIVAVEFNSSDTWVQNNGILSEFNNTEWIQKIVTFITSSTTTQIMVLMSIYNGYGTFWVDDVSLGESLIDTCLSPIVTFNG